MALLEIRGLRKTCPTDWGHTLRAARVLLPLKTSCVPLSLNDVIIVSR